MRLSGRITLYINTYTKCANVSNIDEREIVPSRFQGQSVAFFGREYHVHSCDEFTRAWLRSEGVHLGADEQPPSTTPEPDDAPTKTPAQGR